MNSTKPDVIESETTVTVGETPDMTPRVPEIISQALEERRLTGNLRVIPSSSKIDKSIFKLKGEVKGMVDLVSNDYLGLGARMEQGEFDALRSELARRHSWTSSASRLLSRRQEEYGALEETLEGLYGRPALLYNSGYHANVGLISALGAAGGIILTDRLAHASVYDGLAAGRCKFERFRHNDIRGLERLLDKYEDSAPFIVVVVESIYSMDGDTAPLQSLVSLRRSRPKMLLYVDEAHAVGVRGLRGLGLSEEVGTVSETDFIIGTFGKALASDGAFVICDREWREYMVNCSRSLIFSTAIPPVTAAWSREMLLRAVSMHEEREHLHDLSRWFRDAIAEATGRPTGSESQIVPLVTGTAESAVALATNVREAGYDCLPIRRPTVPPGGERLRFSLSAALDRETLEPLVSVMRPALTGSVNTEVPGGLCNFQES